MHPTELGTKLMVVIETKFLFSCLSVQYVHLYVCIFTTCAIESQGYFCARLYLFYFVSACMCMLSSVHQRIHNLLFINFNTVFVILVYFVVTNARSLWHHNDSWIWQWYPDLQKCDINGKLMTTSQNRRVFDFNVGDDGSDYAGDSRGTTEICR